jgi:hypothetical protein
MRVKRFLRAGKKGKYPYREFNRALREIERLGKISCAAPLGFHSTKGGIAFYLIDQIVEIQRVEVTDLPDEDNPDIYLVVKVMDGEVTGDKFPVFSDRQWEVAEWFDAYRPNGGTEIQYLPAAGDIPSQEVKWKAFPQGADNKGQYQFMHHVMVTTNEDGFDFDRAHPMLDLEESP